MNEAAQYKESTFKIDADTTEDDLYRHLDWLASIGLDPRPELERIMAQLLASLDSEGESGVACQFLAKVRPERTGAVKHFGPLVKRRKRRWTQWVNYTGARTRGFSSWC